MLAPELRLIDDAGHQIVRVQYDHFGAEYAYTWDGRDALEEGDQVIIELARYRQATVIGLGSDWAGALDPVHEKLP